VKPPPGTSQERVVSLVLAQSYSSQFLRHDRKHLLFSVLRAIVSCCNSSFPAKGEDKMVKKLLTLLFMAVLAFPMSMLAQDTMKPDAPMKAAKEVRWEGTVVRTSPDKSTLTVRKGDGGVEMTIVYDSSTKWVSQYHAAKQVTDIDATQVKEGDRVICKGTWEKKGVFHATLISKRLSHPA
jgi:hypothetical protein